jgi:zinc/manganese transport system permease protein
MIAMFSHDFMRHAFLAATFIAAASGLVGYLLVLRAQVFTADALSHVAFTGALAALAAGFDARLGLFVITAAVAIGIGTVGRRGRPDDVVTGGFFAWILGLGVFFLSIYTTHRSAGNGSASVSVLFGSILGLSMSQTVVAVAVGAVVCVLMVVIARPLLFATLDEAVAAARGVPVRLLGLGFLVLVGVTAAEATQAVGALLILGLLATPGAAAARLTSRPWRAMWLSAAIAVVSVWIGLSINYAVPKLPPSFAILATATMAYVAAALLGRRQRSVVRSSARQDSVSLSPVDHQMKSPSANAAEAPGQTSTLRSDAMS